MLDNERRDGDALQHGPSHLSSNNRWCSTLPSLLGLPLWSELWQTSRDALVSPFLVTWLEWVTSRDLMWRHVAFGPRLDVHWPLCKALQSYSTATRTNVNGLLLTLETRTDIRLRLDLLIVSSLTATEKHSVRGRTTRDTWHMFIKNITSTSEYIGSFPAHLDT